MDLDQPVTPTPLFSSIPTSSSFQPSHRITTELFHIPATSTATDVATASPTIAVGNTEPDRDRVQCIPH